MSCLIAAVGAKGLYAVSPTLSVLCNPLWLLPSSSTPHCFVLSWQSLAYLKQTVSPPIVISRSFRNMLNKKGLLTLPFVVPLFYMLPITDNAIIYHPLHSAL